MARYVYPFAQGTSYAHEHWDGGLAVDVFGTRGSAIVACTDGTAEVANFSKGGHTVTLFGDDGREYYHAHLVQGSGVGGRVTIGQLIGLMDNTGNAVDRPTHCHWAAGSIGNDGAGTIAPWTLLDAWPRVLGDATEPPVNPNLRRQMLDWQAARRQLGQDPHDWAAFRAHLIAVGAPDPGGHEADGFREGARRSIEDVERENANIRSQLATWQAARRQLGQDPFNYAAFRAHVVAIGAVDPGPQEFVGFRDGAGPSMSARFGAAAPGIGPVGSGPAGSAGLMAERAPLVAEVARLNEELAREMGRSSAVMVHGVVPSIALLEEVLASDQPDRARIEAVLALLRRFGGTS